MVADWVDLSGKQLVGRMQGAMAEGNRINEEYRTRLAGTFLSAGISLIPCEHLQDDQFIVSTAIYKAAKKLCEE